MVGVETPDIPLMPSSRQPVHRLHRRLARIAALRVVSTGCDTRDPMQQFHELQDSPQSRGDLDNVTKAGEGATASRAQVSDHTAVARQYVLSKHLLREVHRGFMHFWQLVHTLCKSDARSFTAGGAEHR